MITHELSLEVLVGLRQEIPMKTPGEYIENLIKKEKRTICGVMSGTSADSIDVAICEISGSGVSNSNGPGAQVVLRSFHKNLLGKELQGKIRNVASSSLRQLCELDYEIAEEFANAVLLSLKKSGLTITDIDLIASHGQTVYHHSSEGGSRKTTWQFGKGDVIAVCTGIPVVSDFRVKDIAVGGEGAPLTPYADIVLYCAMPGRGILNLGGIANLTILGNSLAEIIGFDTGPANSPLDRLVMKHTNSRRSFDHDGKLARRGKVNETFLKELLDSDPYLKLQPPKSTGFEMYGDAFVEAVEKAHGGIDENLIATITEFVAESIGRGIRDFVPAERKPTELVVAGGGAKNIYLMERLMELLSPIKVVISDDMGVPASAREAMAFAVLGNDALFGLPTSLPSVTGALKAMSLGSFSFPN